MIGDCGGLVLGFVAIAVSGILGGNSEVLGSDSAGIVRVYSLLPLRLRPRLRRGGRLGRHISSRCADFIGDVFEIL